MSASATVSGTVPTAAGSPRTDYNNRAYNVNSDGNVGNYNWDVTNSYGRRPAFGIFPILFIIRK